MNMECTKSDWKLFRELIPEWQEAYMERLNKEYIRLLSSEKDASEKFWALEKRIRQDKRKPGVQIELQKQEVVYDLVALIQEKVIGYEDLDGFSEGVKEAVKFLLDRGRQRK